MTDLAQLVIEVDSRMVDRASVSLDRLQDSSGRAERGTSRLRRETDSAAAATARMQRQVDGLYRRLTQVASLLGVGLGFREMIRAVDAWTNAGNRLQSTGIAIERVAEAQRTLADLAIETRSDFSSTIELYSRMAANSTELGATQDQLLTITRAVNQAMILGGASASEAAGAIRQLGQAMGSGTLRGDELNSIMEQSIPLSQAIARELGVSIGQLREMGAQGLITARSVFDALLNSAEGFDQAFRQTTQTIGQSFTNLQTRFIEFLGRFDEAVGVSDKLAGALDFLGQHLDLVAAGLALIAARMVGVPIVALIANIYRAAAATAVYDIATRRLNIGLTAANARAAVLSRTLAFFGGPIGLAVSAIAVGLTLWSTRADTASEAMTRHREIVDAVRDAYERVNGEVDDWAAAVEGVTGQQAFNNLEEQADRLMDTMRDLRRETEGVFISAEAPPVVLVMLDQVMQAVEMLENGQIVAEQFAARMDFVAASLADVGGSGAQIVREMALSLLDMSDGAGQATNAVREAVQALEPFYDELSDSQRAVVDFWRELLNVQSAGYAAAGGIGAAGGAARGSVSDFLAAAGAADAFAGALRGLAGIAPVQLSDMEQIGQFVGQGGAAIARGVMGNLGAMGLPSLGTIQNAMDAWTQLRTDAEEAVTRVTAEQAATRAGLLQDVEVRAFEAGRDAMTTALYNEQQAYAGIREEMIANGATQAELNQLAEYHADILAGIRAQYADTESGGGGGGGTSSDVLNDAIERTWQSIEALQQEAEMLGMTEAEAAAYRTEMELLNIARAEGVSLSPEEIAAIHEVAAAYGQATAELIRQQEQMERARERFENWKSATKDFFSTFVDGLREGKTAMEALGDALGRLADRLIDMALDMAINALFNSLANLGSSGSFPILGMLFGGAATGGLITGPGSGTSDSIPMMLSNGEFVVNADATRRHLDLLRAINDNRLTDYSAMGNVQALRQTGGGGGPTIHINQNIDARGSNLSEAQLNGILKRSKKELMEELPQALERHGVNRRFR